MASPEEVKAYNEKNAATIQTLLADMGCRPVLFVGSGLSQRYAGGPSWLNLLEALAKKIGMEPAHFAFLAQQAGGDLIQLGSLIADEVHTWAFSAGKNSFPAELFQPQREKDNFIKHLAAGLLRELTGNLQVLTPPLSNEVTLLKKVYPHAIITTNYDSMLEEIFPDFECVVGEKIIPFSLNLFGELYKIHGTYTTPETLVLTGRDYDRYRVRRRYISSKLMTYFAEYPVLIFGYSLSDRNINAIISDLGEALRDKGGLLENVYYVQFCPNLEKVGGLQEEYAVPAADPGAPPLRVKTIITDDFTWVYKALGDTANPTPISTKALRHLAARVVELVRVDVPKNRIEIDYEQVKRLSDHPDQLAQVLGIGNVHSPNVDYPYSLTEIGRKLGYSHWYRANELIKVANKKLSYDLKGSDNEYHLGFRGGTKAEFHKYSEAAFELLRDLKREGEAALTTTTAPS